MNRGATAAAGVLLRASTREPRDGDALGYPRPVITDRAAAGGFVSSGRRGKGLAACRGEITLPRGNPLLCPQKTHRPSFEEVKIFDGSLADGMSLARHRH